MKDLPSPPSGALHTPPSTTPPMPSESTVSPGAQPSVTMTAATSEPLLTSPARLQKIDQLREKNIGSYIPLPQLVAVGDQSSGKSSLLESLSCIPFPRGQELCTRYATQISHRREAECSIEITVIPGPHASAEHKKALEAYSEKLETTAELRKAFPRILEWVNALMGIKTPANPDGEHTFSEDVLKIEKCGPNEDYLTIIDVPGIFRNVTEGVTTDEDKELVKNMVNRYIKDDRTVILAVLPCNVDVATQEILALAKEVDPAGDRTLGILTKADLLIEQSAKASVAGLVEGNKKPLKLGYHIVTNRGGDDHGDEDDVVAAKSLRTREALFQKQPWIYLPGDRVGISCLRERLSEVLGEITDRAFPQLRTETRERLDKAMYKLEELGISRESEREQRQYLVGIASSFQTLARAALNADYSAHPALAKKELRLITAVVSFSDKFNNEFNKYAHKYSFQSDAAPPACKNGEAGKSGGFTVPDPAKFPELSKTITTKWDTTEPIAGIMGWIQDVHQLSRGLDLGTLGPGIIAVAFPEQSAKWDLAATQYLSKIILLVHQFIAEALKAVCADPQVVKRILSAIMDKLTERYESAMRQGQLLVDVERQLKPYTLNHYFNSNQQRSYGERMKATLQKKAWEVSYTDPKTPNKTVVSLNVIADAVVNKSNAEFNQESIHDILDAYYKVAYKRFVDCIFKQAVDYKLLSGPDNPLKVFCEQWVLGLDTDQLLAMAGESRRTRDMKERLKREIHDLEIAMEILL